VGRGRCGAAPARSSFVPQLLTALAEGFRDRFGTVAAAQGLRMGALQVVSLCISQGPAVAEADPDGGGQAGLRDSGTNHGLSWWFLAGRGVAATSSAA
jgi:hypothetical protein